MPLRTWLSLIVGLVLLTSTVLWSTGRLSLPGPLARLRVLPPGAMNDAPGRLAAPPGRDRGREFRDDLLADIWRDRLFTVTVHVALCDSRKSKVSDPNLGLVDNPFKNIYWGAMYGLERFFNDQKEWSLAYAHSRRSRSVRLPLRRVVFSRHVVPGEQWRQRGVTESFDIAMLGIAWSGRAAGDAMRATLMDALGLQPPRDIRVGGTMLRFGSKSKVVGYVGYNVLRDDDTILPKPTEPLPPPDPRGVFFISPSSEPSVGAALRRLGLHPILLTTDQVTPEAYVLYGLMEALVSGRIETGFADLAARQYSRYKKIKLQDARKLFVP